MATTSSTLTSTAVRFDGIRRSDVVAMPELRRLRCQRAVVDAIDAVAATNFRSECLVVEILCSKFDEAIDGALMCLCRWRCDGSCAAYELICLSRNRNWCHFVDSTVVSHDDFRMMNEPVVPVLGKLFVWSVLIRWRWW